MSGMKKVLLLGVIGLIMSGLMGCTKISKEYAWEKVKDNGLLGDIHTDKARYVPGSPVKFEMVVRKESSGGKLEIRYRHLGDTVGKETVKIPVDGGKVSWAWSSPKADDQGYFVDAYLVKGIGVEDHASTAVDVSSDWGKFPRYGYLADFPTMKAAEQEAVIDRLSRFHITGIQFYDWQWRHHEPLKLEEGKPATVWPDIANRETAFETVNRYIELAHAKDIKAMNYNLLFGASAGALADGVKPEWGLYTDPLHQNQDHHPLPDNWQSDIYLQDPSNPAWQDYLLSAEKRVFEALDFDGWHVDQLGDRGNLYTYSGKKVNLFQGYEGFIKAAKEKLDVDYVMNAVSQYGQQFIAKSPVKFMYSELWKGQDKYKDLKTTIDNNYKWSGDQLNTVIAAYMNYDLAEGAGEFNAPGVLLTDAVIFASGGAHIELGENMLAKEYFPNRNLSIPRALEAQLIAYYDFLTSYQNLLRDGAEEKDTTISLKVGIQSTERSVELSAEPEAGKIWALTKTKDNQDIIQLVNLASATSDSWRDLRGEQPEPERLKNLNVTLPVEQKVKRVWLATPDEHGGSPVALKKKMNEDGTLSFTIPSLYYWDMVVVEYDTKE